MKFEIDFNRGYNDNLLKKLGAEEEHFEEWSAHFVKIEGFEDLEALLHILDSLTGSIYAAVVSFDPPTIFLDDKV